MLHTCVCSADTVLNALWNPDTTITQHIIQHLLHVALRIVNDLKANFHHDKYDDHPLQTDMMSVTKVR